MNTNQPKVTTNSSHCILANILLFKAQPLDRHTLNASNHLHRNLAYSLLGTLHDHDLLLLVLALLYLRTTREGWRVIDHCLVFNTKWDTKGRILFDGIHSLHQHYQRLSATAHWSGYHWKWLRCHIHLCYYMFVQNNLRIPVKSGEFEGNNPYRVKSLIRFWNSGQIRRT